ncbi:50S ribosomal protein L21 [Planktomarina temperata]|nr:50S ribosomal protein L21 [Planktomarina temperata]
MFAVMKTGGKQYRVQSGDVLRVEKLAADAGEMIQFNEVLMVGSTVGAPMIAGAGVQAEVIDQIKGPKTINFVKRRRKHSSKRTKGHRQKLTLVRIKDILEKGADKSGVKAAIGAGSVPYVATPVVEAAPAENKPAAKKAAAKPAAAKKPAAAAKPAAAKKPATAKKPAAAKASAEKPAAKTATAKKPAAAKASAEKPAAKTAAAKKPAAKKPAAKKPAADKE